MEPYSPVEGSPLIPPDILTVYFASFLLLLTAIYVFLRFKRKEARVGQQLRTVFYLAVVIKCILLVGGGFLTAYWFLPKPSVARTTPSLGVSDFPINQKIEIVFDRPISRTLLEKSITPETPGVWVFESSIYRTHFFRRVVFYPTTSLKPHTQYTISLSNIKNTIRTTEPFIYELTFKTQDAPNVLSVEPGHGKTDTRIDTRIIVSLSNPNDLVSEFQFEIVPQVSFQTVLNRSKKFYTLAFVEPLRQGTQYTLRITKTDLTWNLESKEIIVREPTVEAYTGSFTTKEPPGIESFTPSESNILLQTPISVSFSQSMDRKSVEDYLSFEPNINGTISWKDDKTFIFTPEKLTFETLYKVKIAKGARGTDGGFFEEDVEKTFNTIGSVKVANMNPANGWKGVGIHGPIRLAFDQEVDRASAEEKFSISPPVEGAFFWEGNTMIFSPNESFSYSTAYTVTVAQGVKSAEGLDSNSIFSSIFTTQDTTHKLSVPAFLQQHALSCEVAALRMALAFRGVDVTEEVLLSHVGIDSTPHSGNIWGNPYNAFVGNVDGKQMVNGYGVYWEPIARTARNFRNADSFEGWSIEQLTEALSAGNPVVIWVYSSRGVSTNWFTPGGQQIYAVRDEHAVVVVGFVGPAKNPPAIIVNDPLIGQVYWQRDLFEKKFNIFGRSGVVIY